MHFLKSASAGESVEPKGVTFRPLLTAISKLPFHHNLQC